MDASITRALQQLEPGSEVRLTMADGREISGTVNESDEHRVSLTDAGTVEADQVEDLVVLRSSDGPE